MQLNIPANAIGMYVELGKFKGKIWTWPVVRNSRESWQWACLGRDGEEETRERAIASARRWIKGEGIKPHEGD